MVELCTIRTLIGRSRITFVESDAAVADQTHVAIRHFALHWSTGLDLAGRPVGHPGCTCSRQLRCADLPECTRGPPRQATPLQGAATRQLVLTRWEITSADSHKPWS